MRRSVCGNLFQIIGERERGTTVHTRRPFELDNDILILYTAHTRWELGGCVHKRVLWRKTSLGRHTDGLGVGIDGEDRPLLPVYPAADPHHDREEQNAAAARRDADDGTHGQPTIVARSWWRRRQAGGVGDGAGYGWHGLHCDAQRGAGDCGRAEVGGDRALHGGHGGGGWHRNGGGDDHGGGGHADGDQRRVDAGGGGDLVPQAGGVGVVAHIAAGRDGEHHRFARERRRRRQRRRRSAHL